MISLKDNFSDFNDKEPVIFKQEIVPIFQNKIYESENDAFRAPRGSVELVQSQQSGFVFNKVFEPSRMEYDLNYQNEQGISDYFKGHLNVVLELLSSFDLHEKKIVEIGCGKGVFFEMMLKAGWDCWGFDPTYEGTNRRIVKNYFTEENNSINADVIIMRHTLEHIPNPFSFLHTIAKANNYRGFLFVEVPTFDWIFEKRAFWDVFYEHCNYFNEQSLSVMFNDAITGSFFGGQYIYMWANLAQLKTTIGPIPHFTPFDGTVFRTKLEYFKHFLQTHSDIAVWGAGAKGSTFLNLLDKEKKHIKYVIDINPAKQNKFIACTGHKIYSPLFLDESPVKNILVMNENYLEEIRNAIGFRKTNIYNL